MCRNKPQACFIAIRDLRPQCRNFRPVRAELVEACAIQKQADKHHGYLQFALSTLRQAHAAMPQGQNEVFM